MNSKEKLLKLFKVYSSNLKFHFPVPELENKFVCPICLRVFPQSAIETKDITIEHIIPQRIRKSFLTLTCQDCNNLGGTILDSHLVTRLRIEDKLAGKDPLPLRGKLIAGSEQITADIYLSAEKDPNIRIIGIPELNNPEQVKKFNDTLNTGLRSFQINGNLGTE
jgi:hypothetical protein